MTVRRRKPSPLNARQLLTACLEPYDDLSLERLRLLEGHDFAADIARGRTALVETVSTPYAKLPMIHGKGKTT